MRSIKHILLTSLVLVFIATSCQDEDQVFGDIIVPSNLSVSFEIEGQDADNPNGDGSGFVNFTASADNAITYRFIFGDNTSDEVTPYGDVRHRYNLTGVNTYTVSVIASGIAGTSTTTSFTIDVFSAFEDQQAKELLSGGPAGSSQTWYLALDRPAHLGVGPTIGLDIAIDGEANTYWFPAFFGATPFEKCGPEISDCFCDEELTFSLDSNDQLTYTIENFGSTFVNGGHQLGLFGTEEGEDACFELDVTGVSNVSLSPSDQNLPEGETRGTVMTFTNSLNMGYYVGASQYEILELTENFLYVRFVDALNADLAWYLKFSTEPPTQDD